MNKTIEKSITDVASAAQTVSANYTWYLNAYQLHGNLWLSWSTTAPRPPSDKSLAQIRRNVKKWQWDSNDSGGWDTGLPWGSDWYCAWNAQKNPNGPYAYVVQLITKQSR